MPFRPNKTVAFTWLLLPLLLSGTSSLSVPSLYDDYAAAQQRRAAVEEQLLQRPEGARELPCYDDATAASPLEHTNNNKAELASSVAPITDGAKGKVKKKKSSRPSPGGGFGMGQKQKAVVEPKGMTRAQSQLASRMAATVLRDGAIRLPDLLSTESCQTLRQHVLQIQSDVTDLQKQANNNGFDPQAYYGVEPGRTCRTDLLLPLDEKIEAAFSELLGSNSPLRSLFAELLPLSSPLYEVAAVITSPGSHRQTIHPDLPHKPDCPLYVVFVALQDVTPDMGPTTFLLKSQKDPLPELETLDSVLESSDCVISTLNAGDAVVFDARILHCGNANTSDRDRALFNFSFRRPDTGPLGYDGSIRRTYEEKLTLKDMLLVADGLDGWGKGGKTLEREYGNGIVKH